MAFLIHSTDDGHVPPWEYLNPGDVTPRVGLALTLSGGSLNVASGSTAPSYICMAEEPVGSGAVPVIRVTDDIIFETTLGADAAELAPGDAVDLTTDGLQAVKTSTGAGAAAVVSVLGTNSGDAVRIRFDVSSH